MLNILSFLNVKTQQFVKANILFVLKLGINLNFPQTGTQKIYRLLIVVGHTGIFSVDVVRPKKVEDMDIN